MSDENGGALEARGHYTSPDLSHFVGWNNPPEEHQYATILTILTEGRLIHLQTERSIERTDVETRIPLPGGRAHYDSIKVSFGLGGAGRPQAEIGGKVQLKRGAKISRNELYVPQVVCFCDIPLDHLHYHMRKYGKFGLMFPKRFLVRQGVSPVLYVANESLVEDPEWHRDRSEDEAEDRRLSKERVELQRRHASLDPADEAAFAAWQADLESNRLATNRAVMQRHEIARSELMDREIEPLMDSLDRAIKTLREAGDRDAGELTCLRDFLVAQFFAYLKAFDSARDEYDPANYYMEREWRTTRTVRFAHSDIARIIVPRSYVERLRAESGFTGEVLAVEDLA